MRIINSILLICLALLSGCADPGEPTTPIQVDERLILLKEVLNGPLFTPAGMLKSESFYYGPNTLQYRTDFYYDTEGRELLKVTIQNLDTSAVFLNEYLEDGKLNQTGVYSLGPEGFVFTHYFKRFYENSGQTINNMKGRDDNFSQHEQFKFDEKGRKISYRRGSDTLYSLHKYIYQNEQSRQIMEEHYFESGTTDPLYRYKFDYKEDGLLRAKFISFLGEFNRIEFEYFYDDKMRLSEEIKNDIRFLSGPIERKTFEYY
ncbi:hypothetical protein [Algoriphagus sp.]|uniref:hypothetical protein n=1 Tax=Algoriphagus sp. TaxID=1872435 RepID=UPI002719E45A|nr:hypothetical protein [Algoriphagus sp.]MDO8965466.1 hypothetical protein [Algoriphagus sp.]MDP3201505.1 hypothetical protein [Algoriphagus sp.]